MAVLWMLVGENRAPGADGTAAKAIVKEAVIPAPRGEVWKAWTTSDGATTFLAPQAHIELEIGGPYELYFVPTAPAGARGSEGCKILSYLPGEMLSYDWNAPPQFPDVRHGPHTWVVVRLDDMPNKGTRVRIAHLGWHEGDNWDKAYRYFDRAWDVVLQRLGQRFTQGPIDWKAVADPAKR
jgi:uncharacterized protein YndB with AHSA1/START domain